MWHLFLKTSFRISVYGKGTGNVPIRRFPQPWCFPGTPLAVGSMISTECRETLQQWVFCVLRSPRHGLPSASSCPVHKLLLRLPAVSRLLRGHGHAMSSVALLWHRRSPGDVPVPQRHPVLASCVCLRLVVQRPVRPEPGFVRDQQSPLWNTQRRPRKTTQIYYKRTSTEHICVNVCIQKLCSIVQSYR